MTTMSALERKVGEKTLEHMFDRHTIKHVLSEIKYEDEETWDGIVAATGRAAIAAVLAELPTMPIIGAAVLQALEGAGLEASATALANYRDALAAFERSRGEG